MKQTIRIIGGKYRGKKISFPVVDGLRPTPDRVRETLFNWLMREIHNARCLDAFAGSGALGLEALSRGASQVVLVEQAPIAYRNLQQIVTQFHSPAISLYHADILKLIPTLPSCFDIIFLDPPFSQEIIPTVVTSITQHNLLKLGGLLYLESEKAIELSPDIWQQIKLKQAGQVVYGLYQKYA